MLGVSIDSSPANKEFADKIDVKFPLLSDMTRKVSKDYGVLDEENQVARRTTFVVDGNGIIQHIEGGATAMDPTGAHTVCERISKKK